MSSARRTWSKIFVVCSQGEALDTWEMKGEGEGENMGDGESMGEE